MFSSCKCTSTLRLSHRLYLQNLIVIYNHYLCEQIVSQLTSYTIIPLMLILAHLIGIIDYYSKLARIYMLIHIGVTCSLMPTINKCWYSQHSSNFELVQIKKSPTTLRTKVSGQCYSILYKKHQQCLSLRKTFLLTCYKQIKPQI